MHITFVIPYFYPALQYGGQPKSSYDLARALASRGHMVTVLTTDTGGDSRLALGSETPAVRNLEGIKVFYYSNLSNYLAFHHRIFLPLAMFKDMHRQLAGCDIVHVHELRSLPSVAAYKAAKKLRLPLVLSPHGGLRWLGKQTAKFLFDRLWGRSILRYAAKLLAVSTIEEEDARLFDVEQRQIRQLPNLIFPEDYAELPERGGFRNLWKIREEKIVLFLGRLHWIKGADLLIDAFLQAGAAMENVHLVIAGPDDGQERELRRKLEGTEFQKRTTFTGYLDHAAKLSAFVDANVVVIPSRSEVFAITALEALLCGRRVLLSSACGLVPMPGKQCGVWQFESGNLRDLSDKLMNLLIETPVESSDGREFVVREFSPAAVAGRAERIYEEAIERR